MVRKKITVPYLHSLKRLGTRITALTAYDFPTATLVDAAGIDLILVGDTLASVALGHETTIPVTLEEMLHSLRAVRRGVRSALLVADLPFGYCHAGSTSRAMDASITYMKEGAEAVKLEGGRKRCRLIRELVDAEIPVMGHIGLTPQSFHKMGGYRIQGKTTEEAREILEDALALEKAGAFAVVLEGIPVEVASKITQELSIPTIGIGAGDACDGQILVLSDLLGLTVPCGPPPHGSESVIKGKKPKFVREYLQLRDLIIEAVQQYSADVRSGKFPSAEETYNLPEKEKKEGDPLFEKKNYIPSSSFS